jgi:hypothetical protein
MSIEQLLEREREKIALLMTLHNYVLHIEQLILTFGAK